MPAGYKYSQPKTKRTTSTITNGEMTYGGDGMGGSNGILDYPADQGTGGKKGGVDYTSSGRYGHNMHYPGGGGKTGGQSKGHNSPAMKGGLNKGKGGY